LNPLTYKIDFEMRLTPLTACSSISEAWIAVDNITDSNVFLLADIN